jgi:hypothetical protein
MVLFRPMRTAFTHDSGHEGSDIGSLTRALSLASECTELGYQQ